MATPKKVRKLDQSEDDSVSGFVHDVSPMKTSAKGHSYFNAKFQENDMVSDMVAYGEKMHADLKHMEAQRTPIKLSPVERVASWKNPGNFDFKVTNRTHITAARSLPFAFEKPEQQEDKKCKEVKINELQHIPEETKVTVTAKVIKKLETTEQSLKFNRSMTRPAYIIADPSGSIELTLWGPPEQIIKGSSYTFSHVTVEKKLSTNVLTTIKKATDIKGASPVTEFHPKKEYLQIIGVHIQRETKCLFCNADVTVNEEVATVKCAACSRRFLKEAVSYNTKCELTAKSQHDTINNYSLPAQVLDKFTHSIKDNDDKELFLLTQNRLRLS